MRFSLFQVIRLSLLSTLFIADGLFAQGVIVIPQPCTIEIVFPSQSQTVTGTLTPNVSYRFCVAEATTITLTGGPQGITMSGTSFDTSLLASGQYQLQATSVGTMRPIVFQKEISINIIGDERGPEVNLTSPQFNSLQQGTIQVQASATDANQVDRVTFYANNSNLGSDTSAPFSANLNTRIFPNGSSVRLRAVARDRFGNTSEATSTIMVDNSPPPTPTPTPTPTPLPTPRPTPAPTSPPLQTPIPTPQIDTSTPSVRITSHRDGQAISGAVVFNVDAGAPGGIEEVELFLDGVSIGLDTSEPYRFQLDTNLISNGGYNLTARATISTGGTIEDEMSIAVANSDSVGTSVIITAPQEGDIVSGQVLISTLALDNVAIRDVELSVDGVFVDSTSLPPYNFRLNSTRFADGTYTVTVVANDFSGNSSEASINISILNPSETDISNQTGDQASQLGFNTGLIALTVQLEDLLRLVRKNNVDDEVRDSILGLSSTLIEFIRENETTVAQNSRNLPKLALRAQKNISRTLRSKKKRKARKRVRRAIRTMRQIRKNLM